MQPCCSSIHKQTPNWALHIWRQAAQRSPKVGLQSPGVTARHARCWQRRIALSRKLLRAALQVQAQEEEQQQQTQQDQAQQQQQQVTRRFALGCEVVESNEPFPEPPANDMWEGEAWEV